MLLWPQRLPGPRSNDPSLTCDRTTAGRRHGASVAKTGVNADFAKNTEGREMTNSKLQAALDELERLRDTVKGFKERNGSLPDPDSDADRALFPLQTFTSELQKLNLGNMLNKI